jgi:hypothetical protein
MDLEILQDQEEFMDTASINWKLFIKKKKRKKKGSGGGVNLSIKILLSSYPSGVGRFQKVIARSSIR